MELVTEQNTYLSLLKGSKIQNFQLIICAKSGYGKGLALEGIADELHRQGYVVLAIADPKHEVEFGFAMFEPKEFYHVMHLRKIGKAPEKKNVKLYHPFSFNIPTNMLPEINFFTTPIKSLGRAEWGMLSESAWESEAVRLLLNTAQNISDNEGLFSFVHAIQDAVRVRKENKRVVADAKNFYLSVGAGTAKSVVEIANYLQPFKRDFFLSKTNCKYNLNWREILADNENYHVFFSKWISDEKMQEFVVLWLLNEILRNKDFAKHPVCVIIPEVRKLTPFKPEGYKLFLSNAITEALSTMRSMGRGMSSLLDTQVFSDVSEEVRNSATVTLFGEVAPSDAEKISKAMNYKREIRQQLSKMEYENSYLIAGKEDMGGITPFFPCHMHKEESYNFLEMYRRNYSEKMKRYTELIKEMQKDLSEEERKVRERVKKRMKEEKERLEQEKREREERAEQRDKSGQKIEKAKEIEDKSKLQMMKLVYQYKQDNPKISWRKLGEKFDVSHITAKKYCEDYEKSGEAEKEKQLTKETVTEEFVGDGVMQEEIDENFEDEVEEE